MKFGLVVIFRKYHRILALILCAPMILIIITGMLTTVEETWEFVNIGFSRSQLLSIHTGAIFNIHAFYPILLGMGMIGLLITGLPMSGKRSRKVNPSEVNSD
jgi:hypothetical protein